MTAAPATDPALGVIVAAVRAGLSLRSDGGLLRIRPRSKMTPALAERLRAHKPAILAALDDPRGTAARIVRSIRGDAHGGFVDDLRELWAERVAICTVDGGLSEAAAARVAFEQLIRTVADRVPPRIVGAGRRIR